MDEASLKRLERGIRLYRASRAHKLLANPLRIAYSGLVRKYAVSRARAVPMRARTFWGAPMNVLYPDGVSIGLYQFGFFEAGLTAIFLKYVRPGMTVFDVGAHFGYFTLLASHLVGDAGQVHAFEPTPGTFRILNENAAGRANVRLNQLAVFSRETTLTLTGYEQHPSFNTLGRGNVGDQYKDRLKSTTFSVGATSLDEYVAKSGARPGLIKLDAEGAEGEILDGMGRVLSEVRPMVTLEVGDVTEGSGGTSRRLVERFLSKGYRAIEYDTATAEMKKHEPLNQYDYDNLLFVPGD